MRPPQRRGLTLLEVVVPLSIAALLGAAWWTFSSGATARYAAPAASSGAREQARRALNEMADELRLASADSIRIENGVRGARVEFRTGSGGSIVYAVEPFKDAARLVRVHDGASVTLVDGLRPGGFSAKREASVLTLALAPGVDAPVQTAVALR
ncbi:MAG TPA: hypothetical protein VF950_22235 [Planctomycetota bacterium]